MGFKLTAEEIKKRMIRLTNLEYLHKRAKRKIRKQEKKIGELENKIRELEEENKKKDAIINKFALQIEELRIKVFGKKKKKSKSLSQKKQKTERTAESYHRPIPKDEEVTKEEHHAIDNCDHCQTKLKRKKIVIYVEEDIPIDQIKKEVIKHFVEQGYCPKCKKWMSAIPIPKAKCIIGVKLRKYISYCSIILRLSYQQIEENVRDIWKINVSRGEIQNLLEKEALTLSPEFEQLKQRIQNQPAQHYDESSWKVADGKFGNEVWVMTGTETPESIFLFGKSRGKGILDLLNPNRKIGITDGYGAYINAFIEHQLCWAHLYRHFRDLAKSDVLSENERTTCLSDYVKISRLYEKLKQVLASEFEYAKTHGYFLRKLEEFSTPNQNDAPKIKKIKETLVKTKEKYLTCLKYPGIVPPDNNKAERALRHLVIKRKISYGSKTDKGAQTLSTLASVLLSQKWMNGDDFFRKYLLLGIEKTA
jgi:hypothetical protein